MRHMYRVLKSRSPWLILLLLTDLFFVFLTWLSGPNQFGNMFMMILLFTLFIILAGYWLDQKKQKKQAAALQSFLGDSDEENERRLLEVMDEFWHPKVQELSAGLRAQSQMIKEKDLELSNYREFIEAWTHEIKTPLSLATLVLANHEDEMSPYVYNRMEHVRRTINSDVERILYYARLQSDHVDYKFTRMNLEACIQECFENFKAISDEKNIDIQFNLLPLQITSDKKVLTFILSQLLSNAFKYTSNEKGFVHIVSWSEGMDKGKIHLAIRDNGKGVPPEDMPFLFDKGFTGSRPDRQDATGMGLYLVKKYAQVLSIEVKVEPLSISGQGFGIELIFPYIEAI